MGKRKVVGLYNMREGGTSGLKKEWVVWGYLKNGMDGLTEYENGNEADGGVYHGMGT